MNKLLSQKEIDDLVSSGLYLDNKDGLKTLSINLLVTNSVNFGYNYAMERRNEGYFHKDLIKKVLQKMCKGTSANCYDIYQEMKRQRSIK